MVWLSSSEIGCNFQANASCQKAKWLRYRRFHLNFSSRYSTVYLTRTPWKNKQFDSNHSHFKYFNTQFTAGAKMSQRLKIKTNVSWKRISRFLGAVKQSRKMITISDFCFLWLCGGWGALLPDDCLQLFAKQNGKSAKPSLVLSGNTRTVWIKS